jgi:hypothetical protein
VTCNTSISSPECGSGHHCDAQVESLTSSLERKEAELAERTDELNLANVTIQVCAVEQGLVWVPVLMHFSHWYWCVLRAHVERCFRAWDNVVAAVHRCQIVGVASGIVGDGSWNTVADAVQERVFVGHAHKRAEQALAIHAQELTGELGACVADINALFARLDEVGRPVPSIAACRITIQGLVVMSLSPQVKVQHQHCATDSVCPT